MGKKTKIEFCHWTVNPTPCCSGCPLLDEDPDRNVCYAYSLWRRYTNNGTVQRKGWVKDFRKFELTYVDRIEKACEWKAEENDPDKPWLDNLKTIAFLNDMGDSFSINAKPLWMFPYVPMMEAREDIVWLLLTKWPNLMMNTFRVYGSVPDNFWLGNTVLGTVNSGSVKEMIGIKKRFPGVHTWLSLEPIMVKRFGYVNPDSIIGQWYDWVVLGGASGNNSEPLPVSYVYQTIEACGKHNIPFFFKQWGAYSPILVDGEYTGEYRKIGKYPAGNSVRGKQYLEMPEGMRRGND